MFDTGKRPLVALWVFFLIFRTYAVFCFAPQVFLTKHYRNRRADDPDFFLDFEEIYVIDSRTRSITRAKVMVSKIFKTMFRCSNKIFVPTRFFFHESWHQESWSISPPVRMRTSSHWYPPMCDRLVFLKERKETGGTTCYWSVTGVSLSESSTRYPACFLICMYVALAVSSKLASVEPFWLMERCSLYIPD